MSLIQISDCLGVDCAIKMVQTRLYSVLNPLWGGDWDSYPRIYKNKIQGADGQDYFIPEFLDGDFEYKTDTLFNDKVDVVSFFLVGDRRDMFEFIPTVDVSIIFSCLINNIYPRPQKADEEMLKDILSAIKTIPSIWDLVSIETGVDQVYKEFRKEDLKYSDLSNRHLLRFNFRVTYDFLCD
jgi:hypothetical protein